MPQFETPHQKVSGWGSAHFGPGSFAKQRISAFLMIPLSIWFGVTLIGLSGVSEISALIYLSDPLHAILLAVFIIAMLSHLVIGLREVLTDYVTHDGIKLILTLLVYGFAIAIALLCFFSLLRIAL